MCDNSGYPIPILSARGPHARPAPAAPLEREESQTRVPAPSAPRVVWPLKEQLTLEWIYNSNAIEGSTLTLRETQLILETGLTIGGKSLREHFEVINHREAITYVEGLAGQAAPLTPFHVRQIHKLVLTQIDDRNAGQYRQIPVHIAGATHTPPEAWEVPQRMTDWEAWLRESEPHLHPVELAALAHHQLVWSPFTRSWTATGAPPGW